MRRRSGFTLIEVMVALAVSGIVLVGARALLEATADNASGIIKAATAIDRDVNAERELRALVERMEIGTVAGTDFVGDSSSAHIASWCDTPGGWQERCGVTISLERDSAGVVLIARTSLGEAIRVRHGLRRAALRYLESPAGGGAWLHTWGAGISAPLAIGVMMDRDTLILRIGERG